jgi:hypothetical protein
LIADVVRGERTTVNIQGSSVEGVSMIADISIQKVLKGNPPNLKPRFQFFIPFGFNGYRGVPSHQFGLFFLHPIRVGWEITDGYHPFVVAAPGAPVSTGSPLDKVTFELAYALRSPEASLQTKREAVESLGTLITPRATAALESAANGREIALRALAIAALLERGKTEWIEPAASILVSHERGLDPYLVWRLSGAIELIEVRLRDPKPIPALTRLLRASDATVRRAGAAALRCTRDLKAIGPLMLALQDSDRDVQYQAVIGLAEVTGAPSEWSPATEGFKQDPDRYLKHWRDWAKSRVPPPKT